MSEAPELPLAPGDLSHLPQAQDGPVSLGWWGNFGFMLIEGTGFALAGGAYLYLMSKSPTWPPSGTNAPDLLWGTLFTLGLLLSEIPNRWVRKRADKHDPNGARIGTLVMVLVGLALIVPRVFEFAHFNVHWYDNAYGSVLWMLMVLHTLHIVTDVGDTAVLAAVLYIKGADETHLADVKDNSGYWTFVIVTWLPVYALVYWAPRLT